jgi:hypothetical protein
VVWARAPDAEKASVETSATKAKAAERCERIMTCLEARTKAFGRKSVRKEKRGSSVTTWFLIVIPLHRIN